MTNAEKRWPRITSVTWIVLIVMLSMPLARAPATQDADDKAVSEPTEASGVVRIAMLRTGGALAGRCFSDGFLDLVRFETDIRIEPGFTLISLDSDELFDFPFIVMTGEGAFVLDKPERERLARYLSRGGFVLASAGCSNTAWAASMRRAIGLMFPKARLQELGADHELFHTLFDVTSLSTSNQQRARILGLRLDDRLAIVFSPSGLNDTAAAGGGCCCCGGSEIREAKHINADILIYSLLR